VAEPKKAAESSVRPAETLAEVARSVRGSTTAESGEAAGSRLLLEGFCPLAESLEVRLAESLWQTEGALPFVAGSVPFVVNNSGWSPAAAAQVLFACCREERDTTGPIAVLELGAGVGLFARQLLDAFAELCQREHSDYYQRLIYFVTDSSRRTLQVWQECHLFADHGARVLPALADARQPTRLTTLGGAPVLLPNLRAVFCNYLLDNLPAAVVREQEGIIQQLMVQTWVRPYKLVQHDVRLPLPAKQLPDLIAKAKLHDLAQLRPLLPWLEFEIEFQTVGADELPAVHEVLKYYKNATRAILSHGALSCLEQCLDSLESGGFVLINDYGPVHAEESASFATPGRFGDSWAMPLDFPYLQSHFENMGVQVSCPKHDVERSVHSRLLQRERTPAAEQRFLEVFSDPRLAAAERRPAQSRDAIAAGKFPEALRHFREGLEYCAEDWNLLGQAAQFLNQQLLKHEEALQLAQQAVCVQPWFSSYLWNTLGNCQFSLQLHDEALASYQKAREIHEEDSQAHLNLAYVHAARGELPEALQALAQGLRYDQDGHFRTALLEKQRQILDRMDATEAARWEQLETRSAVLRREED
jgi:tetratricopeptide (TPR) repeat protein